MSHSTVQRAVVVEEIGGPNFLQYDEDYPVPEPTEGQILMKNDISGINYIDTYFRQGLYPSPKPEVLGRKAAGTIVDFRLNTNKLGLSIGDREGRLVRKQWLCRVHCCLGRKGNQDTLRYIQRGCYRVVPQ